MDKPTEAEHIQLIAVLRVLRLSQDGVAGYLHVRKTVVGETEQWLKTEALERVWDILDDQALRNTVNRDLPIIGLDPRILVRAGQVTRQDILRHYDRKVEGISPKAAKVVETVVKLAPDCRIPVDLDLSANTIYIEDLRVAAEEHCRFRFAVYNTWRNLDIENDPSGEALKEDCVFGPTDDNKVILHRPPRPELYSDKDETKKLHCDLAYIDPPIRFDIPKDKYEAWQRRQLTFTITLGYRPT